MQIAEALKNLYKAVTGADTAPDTDQIAELIQALAENWPAETTPETPPGS